MARSRVATVRYETRKLTPYGEVVAVFGELVGAAQECVRKLADPTQAQGERSAASLRDVSRCVKLYEWLKSLAIKTGACSSDEFDGVVGRGRDEIRKALTLSIGYAYHAKLAAEDRRKLALAICDRWRELQAKHDEFDFFYASGRDHVAAERPKCAAKCEWLHLDPDTCLAGPRNNGSLRGSHLCRGSSSGDLAPQKGES